MCLICFFRWILKLNTLGMVFQCGTSQCVSSWVQRTREWSWRSGLHFSMTLQLLLENQESLSVNCGIMKVGRIVFYYKHKSFSNNLSENYYFILLLGSNMLLNNWRSVSDLDYPSIILTLLPLPVGSVCKQNREKRQSQIQVLRLPPRFLPLLCSRKSL